MRGKNVPKLCTGNVPGRPERSLHMREVPEKG